VNFPAGPTAGSRRVLVVDDDRDLREALMKFVRTLGHTVSGAASAKQAIQVATADAPEVAFINMPLADASGGDLARTLRTLVAPSPIQLIALAGLSAGASGHESGDGAFDFFIAKPCPAARIASILSATRRSDDSAPLIESDRGAGR
jgi:CheY-like chemotaxis protein